MTLMGLLLLLLVTVLIDIGVVDKMNRSYAYALTVSE